MTAQNERIYWRILSKNVLKVNTFVDVLSIKKGDRKLLTNYLPEGLNQGVHLTVLITGYDGHSRPTSP